MKDKRKEASAGKVVHRGHEGRNEGEHREKSFKVVVKDKMKEASTGKVVQSGCEGQKEGGQHEKSRSKGL